MAWGRYQWWQTKTNKTKQKKTILLIIYIERDNITFLPLFKGPPISHSPLLTSCCNKHGVGSSLKLVTQKKKVTSSEWPIPCSYKPSFGSITIWTAHLVAGSGCSLQWVKCKCCSSSSSGSSSNVVILILLSSDPITGFWCETQSWLAQCI
jgi:hypothetical protein